MNLEQFATDIRDRWGYGGTILLLIIAIVCAYIAHKILFKVLERWSRHSEVSLAHLLKQYLYHSTRYVLLILAILFISPILDITYHSLVSHVLTIALIAAIANLCIQAIGLMREIFIRKYDVKAEDNLQARKVYTQFKIIERIAIFLIIIFAISIALMTFEKIREVGVSLLASAGIIGIIAGFAAQKSLGTIFAGIQIAIAQPIRIDDVVIIEGEWGRIEEIMLTYVVMKLWDERRLVVPINYFIEKPFQSWTRVSSELIGSVMLYTDFKAPLEQMRQEFNHILSETELWDKRVSALQVTDATDRTIEIRMLASAADSGDTFDLRCLIRERMIIFLQKNYPESLPHTRIEFHKLPENKMEELSAAYVNNNITKANK